MLTNFDGPGRLWDVESGRQIGGTFPTVSGTNSGANEGDGFHLVTATDESILIWNLDLDSWPSIACRLAGSGFTTDEWAQWGEEGTEAPDIC